MLSLVEYTGALESGRPSESRSPNAQYASSETFDGSSQSAPSPGQSIAATEDGELGDGALDLSLPLRKRAVQLGAGEDGSQPSYKKSLIRRYCKFRCLFAAAVASATGTIRKIVCVPILFEQQVVTVRVQCS